MHAVYVKVVRWLALEQKVRPPKALPLPAASDHTTIPQRRFRFSIMMFAPVLVFLSLMAWALASPVASSPDDDFHLVSTWCSSPNSQEYCLPGTDSQSRVVPEGLVKASCFAFKPEVSAGCQKDVDFTATPNTLTSRGNFVGAYPTVFYSTMGIFASNNIEASVVAMRAFTVLLFVALITALYMLLPVRRRPALVWSWVLTTVPLGMFVLASNNPSSWATMGVGFGWIALLGYFDIRASRETIARKIALGAIFAACALMAAGSRGDGAVYFIVAIAAVSILAFSRSRRFLTEAILPVAAVILCVGLYRFSRPVSSVTEAVTPDAAGLIKATLGNILQVPSLWMGVLGREWGLGWLDTSMPSIVWIVGLMCFMGVGFIGLRGLTRRRFTVLIGGTLLLALLPALLLSAAGDSVGENLQPRYILPLVVLFAGIVMLSSDRMPVRLNRAQLVFVAAALTVTQLISLHINMQRYISGIEHPSVNLNSDPQWWWHMALSPMVVWAIGSIAYSALIFIVLHQLRRSSVLQLAGPSGEVIAVGSVE